MLSELLLLAALHISSWNGVAKSPNKISELPNEPKLFKIRQDARTLKGIADPKADRKSQIKTTYIKPLTPQVAIERFFTTAKLQESWFAPEFLAQVSIAQMETLLANLKSVLGAFKEVKAEGKNFVVVGDRATIPASIVLNSKGKISGLFFGNPIPNDVKNVVQDFKNLPGKVGLLVIEGNSTRFALNDNEPLAVGSAFKLAVLKALKAQIASGKINWSDAIALKAQHKVLPNGILQTWPTGSLLTVQTVASLMISQSDNSATDMLIDLVGREAVEAIATRNRPLLTLREFFILKSTKHLDLLTKYHQSNESDRRRILTELAKLPLPTIQELSLKPSIELEAEWFFTNRELCDLIAEVSDLPLMSINSGVANPSDWKHISFKGGSDLGVLNLTTRLTAKNGKTYCVSATWNNSTALDDGKFFNLYSALLESLK